jgi:hypothetical protein
MDLNIDCFKVHSDIPSNLVTSLDFLALCNWFSSCSLPIMCYAISIGPPSIFMIEQMKYPFQDWIQQVPHDLRKNNKSSQTICTQPLFYSRQYQLVLTIKKTHNNNCKLNHWSHAIFDKQFLRQCHNLNGCVQIVCEDLNQLHNAKKSSEVTKFDGMYVWFGIMWLSSLQIHEIALM